MSCEIGPAKVRGSEVVELVGHVAIAGEDHLGIGILGVITDDITDGLVLALARLVIVDDIGEVRRRVTAGVTGADDDLGSAQFIGHDHQMPENRRAGASSRGCRR